MESQPSLETNEEEKSQKPRKKYEKPAVIYLAPLEAMAISCTGGVGLNYKATYPPCGPEIILLTS